MIAAILTSSGVMGFFFLSFVAFETIVTAEMCAVYSIQMKIRSVHGINMDDS